MKQWFKDIVIVVLLIVSFVIVLLKVEHCNPIKNQIVGSDTIMEYSSDTIWSKDTLYVYKKTPTLTDSIFIYNTDTSICNYIREYKDTIEDTNIVIFTDDLIQGILIESGFSYKLKIPIKITDSVTTTITKTNIEKYSISVGALGSTKQLTPILIFNKKDLYLQGGYDIVNKTPVLGIGYKIFKR